MQYQIKEIYIMKTITSLEARIKRVAHLNKMKLNNYEWHKMERAVEGLTFWVDKFNLLTISELNGMMDNFFREFKNPENWAMRQEAIEDLKILGFKFNQTELYKSSK